MDEEKKTGRAHYPGDVRSGQMPGVVGPSDDGRLFKPVMASYDEDANTTTVEFEEV